MKTTVQVCCGILLAVVIVYFATLPYRMRVIREQEEEAAYQQAIRDIEEDTKRKLEHLEHEQFMRESKRKLDASRAYINSLPSTPKVDPNNPFGADASPANP